MPKVIRVRKEKVLEMLRANKAIHHTEFEDSMTTWIRKAHVTVSELLCKLASENARDINLQINLPKPVSYEQEYDKAIRMLELEVREDIDISDEDFEKFFEDNWTWKHSFLSNTSMYKSM